MAQNNRNNTRKNASEKNKPVQVLENWAIRYRENEWYLFDLYFENAALNAVIYNCRLVEGKNGLFIGWPSRQGKDGKWYSVARFNEYPEDLPEAIADAIGF